MDIKETRKTNHEHETLSNSEALDNAYAELKSLLPKEHEFVTSECLDDADLIESMDIYFDLGIVSIVSTFMISLHEGYLNDEWQANSISRVIDEAIKCQEEFDAAVKSLHEDFTQHPEKITVPVKWRENFTKVISWLIANAGNVEDPRARVIEKCKIATKKAFNAVNPLRYTMDIDKLRRGGIAIN
jgi:hypothetical protein